MGKIDCTLRVRMCRCPASLTVAPAGRLVKKTHAHTHRGRCSLCHARQRPARLYGLPPARIQLENCVVHTVDRGVGVWARCNQTQVEADQQHAAAQQHAASDAQVSIWAEHSDSSVITRHVGYCHAAAGDAASGAISACVKAHESARCRTVGVGGSSVHQDQAIQLAVKRASDS
jgi:hypothetical protein